jgi:hypothetical protein
MTKTPTAQNASGDTFEIWNIDGTYYAEQITGLEKNAGRVPAILHAKSVSRLKAELSDHRSNEA